MSLIRRRGGEFSYRDFLVPIGVVLILVSLCANVVSAQADRGTLPLPTQEAAVEEPSGLDMTLWGLILSGGPVMVPIAIGSVIGLSLVIELLFSLRMKKFMQPEFLKSLDDSIRAKEYDKAIKLCENSKLNMAKIFKAVIEKRNLPEEKLEQIIQEQSEKALTKINLFMILLSGTAVIEPMLGLLGTVTGMIRAFNVIAFSGGLGRAELLAVGVAEALITTASGLIVAIPLFAAYYYFRGTYRKVVAGIGESATLFLDSLNASLKQI